MKLKICGLKYAGNLEKVSLLFPDYLGFIFYSRSPRYVGRVLAPEKVRKLPVSIKRVGVFVNSPKANVLKKAKEFGLDFIQLHGKESPEYCSEIAKVFPVIKAFGIHRAFDFSTTEPYTRSCRFFLFDTKSKKHGGTGQTFDWSVLKKYKGKTPFFLSGGIGEDRFKKLKSLGTSPSHKLAQSPPDVVHIHGVDVNSRVEERPGLKDIEKIKRIQKLVKGIP